MAATRPKFPLETLNLLDSTMYRLKWPILELIAPSSGIEDSPGGATLGGRAYTKGRLQRIGTGWRARHCRRRLRSHWALD